MSRKNNTCLTPESFETQNCTSSCSILSCIEPEPLSQKNLKELYNQKKIEELEEIKHFRKYGFTQLSKSKPICWYCTITNTIKTGYFNHFLNPDEACIFYNGNTYTVSIDSLYPVQQLIHYIIFFFFFEHKKLFP